MATSNPTITFDQTTDALFRAWCTAVSNALQTCALIKMGDTGQINLTTVLTPAATNTSRGYEIYQLSRFSDTFTRANGIITAGSQTSTGFAAAVYSATSGGATLPYVSGNQVQAAAAPTSASVATALMDVGSKVHSVDLDIVSSASNGSGTALWDFYLRYTDDNNYIVVEFSKSGGSWGYTLLQKIAGVSTTLASASTFGSTDPTHLRAEIDSNGLITARFLTGANQVYTAQTVTAQVSVNNQGLLTGTKAGFTIISTSVADNLCISEPRPLYIKLEYGSGAGTNFPSFWITTGCSTDGAGTSNSNLQNVRRQVQLQLGSQGPTTTNYFSGDGSYINALMVENSTSNMFFSVERSRDASGNVTQDALIYLTCHYVSGTQFIDGTIWFASAALNSSTNKGSFASPGVGFATAVVGSDTYYFPRIVALPKFVYDLSLMVGYTADIANLVALTATNGGSNHTYMPYNGVNPAGAGATILMMRYE